MMVHKFAEGVECEEFRKAWIPVVARRFDRIKDLVGPPTPNAVYQVVAEDDLSRPVAQ